ncbi:MAG: T9SS type A sorting domain-containing protein [Candidatus Latescibacteria bacterium]|nr:T9SS type A sorting domain-containing protein [Candidatus Latescibacterota bacterium]
MKYIFGIFLIPIFLFAAQAYYHDIENYAECGLPKLEELLKNGEGRARPVLSGTTLFINTTNYRIHYTLSGADATTTAYAESTAVAAESVWSRWTALGWYLPPPDGTNGGNSKYDIYIRALSGYLGVCYPENAYTSPFPDGYTSWVEIINTGITFARLRALVAHEVGHGIQMRYSKFEEPLWAFYENTSVFMEDIVFDDVNTLPGRLTGSTDDPLDSPHFPINRATGVYEYRGALWTHFLDQYYDTYPARTVRRIWDLAGRHAGSHLLKDIDSVLRINYSSNFAKAMGHYAIWRYFSGTRDDGRHYEEGSTYPNATLLRTHTTYPASGTQGTSNPSGPGGNNWIAFSSIGNYRLTIYFDGQNGYEWAAYVLGISSGGVSYEYKIPLEATQDTGRITIPGWDYTTVVLIPVVTHWTSSASNLTYSYSATRTAADKNIAGETFKSDYVGFFINPNPARNQVSINYFTPMHSQASLKIYNATGQIIKSTTLNHNTNSIIWNRKDIYGNTVKPGVYIIELCAGNQTRRKKVVLLD